MANETQRSLITQILELDQDLQRLIRAGWPEAWLHLNLPLGSTRALLAIESGQAHTPRAVADVLGVGRTAVTGMLDRLEAEGLITRAVDPADRRSFMLQLTEKGQALIRQIDDVRREKLMHGLLNMDTAALEALQTGLRALAEAMQTCTTADNNSLPAAGASI